MRCAAYARYSTDKQNPLSIEDQLRKCREFAHGEGWTLLDAHCYADRATSGAAQARPGFDAMMAAAAGHGNGVGRPFDVLLVEDTSRLSRKGNTQEILDTLTFHGVRVIFVEQGIDTANEYADSAVGHKAVDDRSSLKEIARRTHRGLEGRALAGLHTGGRCYGYRSVPIEDALRRDAYGRPVIAGVRLEVDSQQAAVVRRIFTDYAAGDSLKTIARRLNAEAVRPPCPERRGARASWAPSALSVMLHNERYAGRVVWNRTRKLRNPGTGRRVQRERPRDQWKVSERPELRIVDAATCAAVQARLARMAGHGVRPGLCARSQTVRYVLSGILECGVCGAKLTLLSGRYGRNRLERYGSNQKYGCPMHARGTCTNRLLLQRDRLEGEVFAGIQREVLNEQVIRRAVDAFEKRMRERRGRVEQERRQAREMEQRVVKLARLIAENPDGQGSRALLAELRRLEGECQQQRAAQAAPAWSRVELEEKLRAALVNIRERANLDSQRAKAWLAAHCPSIRIRPLGDSYKVEGEWDLLMRSGGAEGQNATALRCIPFVCPLVRAA